MSDESSTRWTVEEALEAIQEHLDAPAPGDAAHDPVQFDGTDRSAREALAFLWVALVEGA
jgi:hypothetical protein